MHGLLASQSCYHSVTLVGVHCGLVVDFFIAKQASLHPFDFVRNLFSFLVIIVLKIATSINAKKNFSCESKIHKLTKPAKLHELQRLSYCNYNYNMVHVASD